MYEWGASVHATSHSRVSRVRSGVIPCTVRYWPYMPVVRLQTMTSATVGIMAGHPLKETQSKSADSDNWPLTFLVVISNNHDLIWNEGAKWSDGNEWSTVSDWNKQKSWVEWWPSGVRGPCEPPREWCDLYVMQFIFTLKVRHTVYS